jgi:hypothetical protein
MPEAVLRQLVLSATAVQILPVAPKLTPLLVIVAAATLVTSLLTQVA